MQSKKKPVKSSQVKLHAQGMKKALGSGPQRRKRGVHRKPEIIYSFHEADSRLQDIFRNHDFGDYPHAKRHQLVRFYQLLMEHQAQDNVTRLLKFRDIAIKHFIDSLIITRFIDLPFPLLDMGTGPGFPGIPLKIHFPQEKIVLAEGVRKRVDFLKHVRDQLKLESLDIIGRNISPDFVYPVQGIITRAVAPVTLTLQNTEQCLPTGGKVFLMKGPNVDEEIKVAAVDWENKFQLEQDIAYQLPHTPHHRRLLVYVKDS